MDDLNTSIKWPESVKSDRQKCVCNPGIIISPHPGFSSMDWEAGKLWDLDPNSSSFLRTNLTYSSVLFFSSVARRPISRQLHGQAKINDDARTVGFDQNISTVQIPVGNSGLVQVWAKVGEDDGKESAEYILKKNFNLLSNVSIHAEFPFPPQNSTLYFCAFPNRR